MKKLIIATLLLAFCLSGCNSKHTTTSSENESQKNETTQTTQTTDDTKKETESPPVTDTNTYGEVTIEMEGGAIITIGLYPQYAPKTVENFVKLVSEGFYDGLTFHRIIPGFMIQGGDPEGTGMGGSDEDIVGEFKANGFSQNTLKHTRGVNSMARSQSFDSASSQFFIMHEDAPHLDGQYAAFGKVLTGIETVDKIASVETGANDKPIKNVVMKKVTLTKEVDYRN